MLITTRNHARFSPWPFIKYVGWFSNYCFGGTIKTFPAGTFNLQPFGRNCQANYVSVDKVKEYKVPSAVSFDNSCAEFHFLYILLFTGFLSTCRMVICASLLCDLGAAIFFYYYSDNMIP